MAWPEPPISNVARTAIIDGTLDVTVGVGVGGVIGGVIGVGGVGP
jgi:hypothetical protein